VGARDGEADAICVAIKPGLKGEKGKREKGGKEINLHLPVCLLTFSPFYPPPLFLLLSAKPSAKEAYQTASPLHPRPEDI
jgi:hypothetical protein